VDSGSSASYISSASCLRLGRSPEGPSSKTTMPPTSLSAKINGSTRADLVVSGQRYPKFSFGVMDNLCADVILGVDFMKLHRSVTFETTGSRDAICLQTRTSTNVQGVCNVLAAKVDAPRIFRTVDKNCKPTETKSRKFGLEDKQFISEEVTKLLQAGIIEPFQSSWRAQVLVVKGERHRKRMVIDYSQTTNRFTYLDEYSLPRIDDQINEIAKCKIYSTLDLKSAYYQIPLAESDREFTAFEANGKLYQHCRLPFGVTNGVAAF